MFMIKKLISCVCALSILGMPIAVSAAPSFQDDSNKPTFQQIPYAPELMDSLTLLQGLNTTNSTLPPSMASAANLTYSINQATAGQYNVFYSNAWTNNTSSYSTSSGFFKVTVKQYMNISGSNAFSGEGYASGNVLLSSSSSWNLLAIVAVIALPVLGPFLGVAAAAGIAGVAGVGALMNTGGTSSYSNSYSGAGSMLAFG